MKKRHLKLIFFISFLFLASISAGAENICISDIYIKGNKKTKPFVILREIPIKIGSYLGEEKLQKKIKNSVENLRNISLFNDISITYEPDTLTNPQVLEQLKREVIIKGDYKPEMGISFYRLVICVTERWYYWPLINIKLEDRNLSSWIKDFDFNKITLGLGIKIDNLWGLDHSLSLSGIFGFEKGLRLSYNNISLDERGIHSIGFSAHTLFNKTVNVMAKENKPVYIKDAKNYLEESVGGSVSYTYRPEIRIRHTLTLGFRHRTIGDSVLIYNKDFWGTSDLVNREYSFGYKYSFDQRDYAVYPTEGYYIEAAVRGATEDDYKFFFAKIYAELQYYLKLSKRWYWGTSLKLSTSYKSRNAYIYDHAIGYNNINLSGYDLYVADGQHFITFNNTLRFLILPQKIVKLNFLRCLSKFYKIPFTIYATAMLDMGYVSQKFPQPTNTLSNSYLLGGGVGIDIVTYYDIVLNVSYAYTRMGKGGFFFGIKSSIF